MNSFDYVIIGAGSAGCVLANRLSADLRTRVLLLEAGRPDKSALIDTPFGLAALLKSKSFNWYYETAPQPHLNGRRLYWPRGKTLGGSSAINAMIYMRGHPADYDEWGVPGWGWADMLPVFKALENNERGADALHGAGGELNVADLRGPNPLSARFVEAAVQAGLPRNDDFNGPEQEGAGLYQVTQKNGRRHSAARAFLDAARARPNLTIVTGAQATRILFEGTRASGVDALTPDGPQTFNAGREVILAGGAINSPQLLLLSGVGPREELARWGIAPVAVLPGVGQNLQDHLDVSVITRDATHQAVGLGWKTGLTMAAAFWKYRRTGAGLFASNAAEAGGFARLSPASARPELQYHFLPTALRDHGRKLSWGYGLTLHVCQLRPASRGSITLASADPLAAPIIQPNYLAEDADLAVLLAGLKQAQRIMKSPALAASNAGTRLAPPPAVQSDAQLTEYIRNHAETIYHPVGTCRMGEDALAVVDDRLRVRGLAGLRVVDAAIMPRLIGGNTNAPVMAIAEKAARFILAERNAPA